MLYRFGSILFSRFLLNLRTFDDGRNDTDTSLRYSSISFDTSLVSNIGAPLEHFTELEEDMDDNNQPRLGATIQQQIENPLSIGILEIPRSNEHRHVVDTWSNIAKSLT